MISNAKSLGGTGRAGDQAPQGELVEKKKNTRFAEMDRLKADKSFMNKLQGTKWKYSDTHTENSD